jgi:uncharacterized protein (DUF1810 family)
VRILPAGLQRVNRGLGLCGPLPPRTAVARVHPLVNSIEGRAISQILGTPDDLKFRSSMTLFAQICPNDPVFKQAIDKYYGGVFDALTLDLLRS